MSPGGQPVVLVVSSDWTLRTMVRAELREANIEALGVETTGDLVESLARGVKPSAVVLDGAELENATARKTFENLPRSIAVLVVDSRITPAPVLPGAEVLRRPVRVQDIVSWVLARLGPKMA